MGYCGRLESHISRSSSFGGYLREKGDFLTEKNFFRCISVQNDRERAFLECYAIGQLCPGHIGLGLKK